MILLIFTLDCLTVSSISSFSLRATNGHHPLTLFCLKIEMVGRSCSFRIMSRVHCLAVFAPRGKRFRSSSIAPGNGESKISQFGIASTLFYTLRMLRKGWLSWKQTATKKVIHKMHLYQTNCSFVPPVPAWVLSGYPGFLSKSRDMHVRFIGDFKLTVGVSVCVDSSFSLSLCIGPVMDCWPVLLLLPSDNWDRLSKTLNWISS